MYKFFLASAWVKPSERLRAAAGAMLGLVFVGFVGVYLNHKFNTPISLIAPLGASSVLLFAVPASPLAQPWSVLGGNILAALVGWGVALTITPIELAAALAVGLSIALMASLRCLHPPSGAIALTVVLGAGKGLAGGSAAFILWSVAANSLLLLVAAFCFHRLTGHAYPETHRKRPVSAGPAQARQEAATTKIINEVLSNSNELLDISSEDLRVLFDKISLRLATTRHDALDCRAIMERAPEALSPDISLSNAFDDIVRSPEHAMLVTNDNAQVIGLVTLADFAKQADIAGEKIRVTFNQRLRNAARLRSAPHHVVGDIMTRHVECLHANDAASCAIVLLAESKAPFLPVLNDAQRLIGVITQARALDVLARHPAA